MEVFPKLSKDRVDDYDDDVFLKNFRLFFDIFLESGADLIILSSSSSETGGLALNVPYSRRLSI